MNMINKSNINTRTPEYDKAFWDAMKFRNPAEDVLSKGKTTIGSNRLPDYTSGKFTEALNAQSIFRNVGTVIFNQGDHNLWAKDCDDKASWIPEGKPIPIYNGIDDFTPYQIKSHKLAAVVRMDEDFVYSPGFNLEKHMVSHMAKAFSRSEEDAFINGSGVDEPLGILAKEGGAEVSVTASTFTYDSIVNLYYSVKPEYRKCGKWLMNDETALVLRKIKDGNGNYIWNHNNDTILGKKVLISEYMPSIEIEKCPVVFGDFSYYWIIDRDHFSVKALREKFAMNSQVGYLGFEFLDGLIVRKDAIKALVISAE